MGAALDLATLADGSTEVAVAAALYNLIVNGDRVTYAAGGGTKPDALTDNTDYFARKSTTANTISIHATAANALSGASALNIGTGAAGAAHTLTYNPGSDLNTCGDGNDENCRLTVETVGADILGTISINDVTRCATLPGIMLTKSQGVTTTGAGTSSTLATRVNGGLRFTGWSTIDNTYFGSGGLTTSYITARNANTDVTHGHLYQLWDAGKIQGCKCDLGYDGPDCSHR